MPLRYELWRAGNGSTLPLERGQDAANAAYLEYKALRDQSFMLRKNTVTCTRPEPPLR